MAEPVAKLAKLDQRCRTQQEVDELACPLERIGKVAVCPVRTDNVVDQHVAVGDQDVHSQTESAVSPDRCYRVLRNLVFGGSRAECVPWLDQRGKLELE